MFYMQQSLNSEAMKSLLLLLAATAAATAAPRRSLGYLELPVDGSRRLIMLYLAARVVIPDPPR